MVCKTRLSTSPRIFLIISAGNGAFGAGWSGTDIGAPREAGSQTRAGGTASVTATVATASGFTSPVTFSYITSAWPPNITAIFDPTAAAPSSWTTQVTVSADNAAMAGTYHLPVVAQTA